MRRPDDFRRALRGADPPVSLLGGRVTFRRPLSSVFTATRWLPEVYRRTLGQGRAYQPHPSVLGGGVQRSGVRPGPTWIQYSMVYEDGYRVADASYDLYELYVGEDTNVDFTASDQPVATSPTLPFSWTPTPPLSGTKELHLVVRKRNKYGLVSQNVFETTLVIDSAGAAQPRLITAPVDLRVNDEAQGNLRITGKYVSHEDPEPADTWELYVVIGSDPTPGVTTPVYSGAMAFFGFEAGFSQVVGAYTPGTVAHVILTALRSGDDERASTDVTLKTLRSSFTIPDSQASQGTSYEQGL